MLDKFKQLYSILPSGITKCLRYMPDRFLFGASYRSTIPSFNKDLQKRNLYKIIHYSRETTLFGKENYPNKFSVDEVYSVLDSLPSITSKMISSSPADFISDKFSSRNAYFTTTGGTGRSPTDVFLSNKSYGVEWAHMHHIWGEAGYSRAGGIKLTLRGKHVDGPGLCKYNPIYNELVVDTFRLSVNNFKEVITEAGKHNIKYIHGYPSLLSEFLDFCKYYGITLDVDAVYLGSEGASLALKSSLSEYFTANVISWYGQTEKVVLAADVRGNNEFKVYTSYGMAAIDKTDGDVGEILGSTFVNQAMPLVKYHTGDYGRLLEKDSGYYLVDIQGRWGKDFVYLDSNKKIPTSSINLHSKIQKEITFFQIHQNEYGSLLIKVLKKKHAAMNESEIKKILYNELSQKLRGFTIDIEFVHDSSCIEKSSRGKMIMLVQNLSQGQN